MLPLASVAVCRSSENWRMCAVSCGISGRTYPGKSYGPHIVKHELSPDDGRIKATGSPGHQTWWAYEGVERHVSFEFVETVQNN